VASGWGHRVPYGDPPLVSWVAMQGPSHPGPGACRQSTDTVIPSGGRAPHSCVIEGRVGWCQVMPLEETKVILRSRGTYHNCPTGMDGRQLFDEWAVGLGWPRSAAVRSDGRIFEGRGRIGRRVDIFCRSVQSRDRVRRWLSAAAAGMLQEKEDRWGRYEPVGFSDKGYNDG